MLCLQASIGVLNDLVDVQHDRGHKPGKPLPRALVPVGIARLIVVAGLAAGLALSLAGGLLTAGLALAGAGVGFAYDLRLKASPWSWLPFALGLPLLPVYAWVGATGGVPGPFLVLIPLAVVAGTGLALANELADAERDQAAGVRTAVGALGHDRAWRVGLGLELIVAAVAGGSLVLYGAPVVAIGAADGSIALLMVGLALSRSPRPLTRERGWEGQCVALGCLALAWLGGLAARGLL